MSIHSFNVITDALGSKILNVSQNSDQSIPPIEASHRILPDGTFRIYDNAASQEVERIVVI